MTDARPPVDDALLAEARRLHREEHPEALAAAEAAVVQARSSDVAVRLALALEFKAGVLMHRGEIDAALAELPEALAAAGRSADTDVLAQVRCTHALLLMDIGQDREALDEALEVARLADESGTLATRARSSITLGFIYRSMDRTDAARGFFERAAHAAERLGDDLLLARSLNNVGNCHSDTGGLEAFDDADPDAASHLRRALACYERAEVAALAAGDLRLRRTILCNIGLCRSDLGEHEPALAIFGEQLARSRAVGSPIGEEMSLRLIGRARLKQGRHADAIVSLEQAASVARASRRVEQEMLSVGMLADAHEQAGDYKAALMHLRQHHRLRDRIVSAGNDRRANAVAVQLGTDEARRQAASADQRAAALEQSNLLLASKARDLVKAAQEDPLTGLHNRRALEALVSDDLERRDNSRPFSLCMIDIDRFKRVNDSFSHLVGDKVLCAIGVILRKCSRHDDLPVRFGGEEFAVVFGNAQLDEARLAGERMRHAVEHHPWDELCAGLTVTVSIGVAASDEARGVDALLKLADRRLYAAKAAGRNRVIASG